MVEPQNHGGDEDGVLTKSRQAGCQWGSIDQINAWVAKATRNLIIEVVYLDNITDDTVHVVANAIYFKGEWEDPFEKEVTADYEFHRLDGSSVKVLFL
ncbi:hypothetical protein PR202_gb16135 [Eleusine coracana subsp. coracana]|uniref:Serpin domain-containing protein n=1 Tax=Eleusine coracana subsp. coracana TaxID=191504 RepID=A0AAV5EZP8_ELECO|nr:hypothetical protein PR202_gb16121 [Eleusine coracana subsp. coracana]GJN28054.1 hypothetical protein PR202_gb16135 [Eleusine coracana subsp. coracana]